jgi:SSS family solute:Na+ symporter
MGWIDWAVLLLTLLGIVLYGTYKNRRQKNLQGYLLGDQNLPWYTIGFSVMATQASAITFLSTPGQAYDDGMRFIQFYFGMPLAVLVVALVIIPIFYKAGVYTAYEYLQKRFGAPARYFTASLFLIQRGLAAGITIYAPSIVLSTVLQVPLHLTNIFIGVLVIVYTVTGGSKAVAQTQKWQLMVMLGGLWVAMAMLLIQIQAYIPLPKAAALASAAGKWNFVSFKFDPADRYNIWSGLLGGFFLSLSYFGTDQSQVGRYLGGKTTRTAKLGLYFNGIFKIPMQLMVLLSGVLVFIFFQFAEVPLHFNSAQVPKTGALSETYRAYELEFSKVKAERKQHIQQWDPQIPNPQFIQSLKESLNREKKMREQTGAWLEENVPGADKNDRDYVFLHYIMNYLPVGLVGLLLATIFSGAMSSTSSELNALGSVTAIDGIIPLSKRTYSDTVKLNLTRGATIFWGILAIFFAALFNLFDNLIQAVNILGSLFYGTILGVFMTGFLLKSIQGKAVFWAAVLTEVSILLLFFASQYGYISLGWLWLNPIGCLGVMVFAVFLQFLMNIISPTKYVGHNE